MSVLRKDHRTRFKDISGSLIPTAGADPAATLVTGRAKYTIFITRLHVHVTTAAAKIWTFKDSSSGPVVLAVLPASATVGDRHVLIENEEGVPCTEGKNFVLGTDGAGVAGSIEWEGYMKPTATMTPADI